jgi:DNA-binding PadR family transcriptional regulator
MTNIDSQRHHLLTHAAAMGGWLTAGDVNDDIRPLLDELVRDGLMQIGQRGRGDVYQLTDAGREAAR